MSHIYFQGAFQRSFGTFPLHGADLIGAIRSATEVGYRAIDTAQLYGNEADMGAALTEIGLPREELCITTKVSPENYAEERFIPSVKQSLVDLRLDYVDVLLVHWPPIGGDIVPSVQLLAEAEKQGLARFIGVSNYNAAMMRTAKATIDTPLVTNQVEFHPLLNQDVLLRTATETGIPLSSYCSVARGEVFKYPLFTEIGSAYGKTAAQVALRWILQKGVSITTMSTKRANIETNFNVMDFTLSSIDMDRIEAMTATNHRIVDRHAVPWAPAWD